MEKTKVDIREGLMQLDREFDLKTSEQGAEGWASYFAEDGIMVGRPDLIKGQEAIRTAMGSVFENPDFSLRWAPEDAGVSDDGTLGFTYGQYVRKHKDQEGNEVTGTGRYTSIWSKQEDGSWKIVWDIGN